MIGAFIPKAGQQASESGKKLKLGSREAFVLAFRTVLPNLFYWESILDLVNGRHP
jgi:hypothetical protein